MLAVFGPLTVPWCHSRKHRNSFCPVDRESGMRERLGQVVEALGREGVSDVLMPLLQSVNRSTGWCI